MVGRPLLQDRLCHHLLMVCYVTTDTIIINIHVLEIHKMNEEYEHEHVKLCITYPIDLHCTMVDKHIKVPQLHVTMVTHAQTVKLHY